MPTPPPPLLFDSGFLRKLEQLHLLARRRFSGSQRAERRSRLIGSSLEFADYRNYVRGDDLRSVDWNIYGRLERLFVKLFEQEQDLPVYLLVDCSASMQWRAEGTDEGPSKLEQTCRLAAALAYIGLANLDRVDLLWFGHELAGNLGLARGKSHFHEVLEYLRKPPAVTGATSLLMTARAFVQRRRQRGLVFVLSDFFDTAGYEQALNLLRHERFEVHAVQVLAPEELEPTATGDLRLQEVEGGGMLDITCDAGLLRSYREEFNTFLDGFEKWCAQRGIGYARALTTTPFDELVLRMLRRSSLVA